MTLNRRKAIFMSLGGVAGMYALSRLGVGSVAYPTLYLRDRLCEATPVDRSGWALGTKVSMTVFGSESGRSKVALEAAFRELELVESIMSLYRPDSQICRLNRTGDLSDPHPYLVRVLDFARRASEQSLGAFDISVQPIWQLYSAAQKKGGLPSDEELGLARSRVDWRKVEVRPGYLRLMDDGMAITLNGIAQGFAVDRVMQVLREQGVLSALVDVGEIGTHGHKPGGEEWKVGIQHPRNSDAYCAVSELSGRCLSTSGDYETYFTDDLRLHHIFDPQTGSSPTELASVSIAAPTAVQADALSTAAMVMGVDRTLQLISTLESVDALLITKSGRTISTAGFPEAQGV